MIHLSHIPSIWDYHTYTHIIHTLSPWVESFSIIYHTCVRLLPRNIVLVWDDYALQLSVWDVIHSTLFAQLNNDKISCFSKVQNRDFNITAAFALEIKSLETKKKFCFHAFVVYWDIISITLYFVDPMVLTRWCG